MAISEFMGSFMRHKVERYARKFLADFCRGFPVEDLEYAAANNLDVLATLLKAEGKKSRQLAVIPFRKLLENATADDLLRLFDEVSPPHAEILRRHRSWFDQQIAAGKQDILGA